MDRFAIRVVRQDRFLIPKPMRDSLGLAKGGEAIAWLEGDRLVIEPGRENRG